jgi:peptide-methionine (S)-S-oxide reductase
MSGIWTHDDVQKRLALESKAREEERRGAKIVTEIAALREFTPAEAYHQKYELRCDSDLIREFQAVYTDEKLMNSTAAMRVNAAISGFVPAAQLRAEIDGYGLSAKAQERLLRSAR